MVWRGVSLSDYLCMGEHVARLTKTDVFSTRGLDVSATNRNSLVGWRDFHAAVRFPKA